VLFDGFCHLCSRSVDFIMKRDPRGRIGFVALQSEAGRCLAGRDIPGETQWKNHALPGNENHKGIGNQFAIEAIGRADHPAYDAERNYDTLILWEEGRFYYYSDAALRIAGYLQFPWNMFSVLRIVPAPLRDLLYRLIARNRYRWFGRREVCRIPSAEERKRFPTRDDLQLEISLLESSEEG